MKGRFEEIAHTHLDVKVRGTVELMCRCPWCDGQSSLQFNIDNGLYCCFKCDEKGNARKLVLKLGGSYTDPAVSVESIQKTLDRLTFRKKDKPVKILPEKYLSRFSFDDGYWEDRGFSKETCETWGLGYDPIMDRNTIAYRDGAGNLLGVIYRLKGDVFPRYVYPLGFDRKGSLFGSWKVSGDKAALVEGSTDVCALDEFGIPSPLAQWGSSLSENQVRLLHRLNIREVVLFYDYDEAGMKAIERSIEMLDTFVIRKVVWDEEKYCWHKRVCNCGEHTWREIGKCQEKIFCDCGRKHAPDPGDLTRREANSMYGNAIIVGRKKWEPRHLAMRKGVQRNRSGK